MPKTYSVYILASKRNGTLYIGVTNGLERRVYEHKNNLVEGFTAKYGVHRLVHYEQTDDIHSAIQREKQLKKWNRKWKLELIEKENPDWKDLSEDWIPSQSLPPRKRGAGNDRKATPERAGTSPAGRAGSSRSVSGVQLSQGKCF